MERLVELIAECRAAAHVLWHEGHHAEARRLDEVADRWEPITGGGVLSDGAGPRRLVLRALEG